MKRTHTWLVVGMGSFLVSNGSWVLPLAAWIAPIFLLRFLRSQRVVPGLVLVSGLFVVAASLMMRGIVPTEGLPFYGIAAYYAFVWFTPYLLDRLIAGPGRGILGTLVFPAAAVTAEYLHALAFGSWTSTAYTQSGNLPLLQMMSVTGLWGVTFVVTWLGPVVNWVWEHDWQLPAIARGVGAYGLILLVILLAGQVRLAAATTPATTVRVAAVLGMAEMREYAPKLEEVDGASKARLSIDYFDRLLEKGRKEARSGAKVIVWPELIGQLPQEVELQALERAREFARTEQVDLAVAYFAYPRDFPDTYGLNKTVLLTAEGDIAWDYVKSSVVPGMKEIPGDWDLPAYDSKVGRLGTAICYDMDFPHRIRQAGARGVELMLVPAWDWAGINPLHAEMAIYRAIENGFSLVRATAQGTSVAVDPYGRVLARMDESLSEEDVMIAHVPVHSTRTLYSMVGDVFAWACAVLLMTLIGVSVVARVRSHPA